MAETFDDFEDRRLRAVETQRGQRQVKPPSTQEEMDRNLNDCGDPACGQPRTTPGHPKRGWIKAGTESNKHGVRWWCSWGCLGKGARILTLRGET